jgi:hypothetical protein
MITRTRTIVAAAVTVLALGALAPIQARPAAAACNEPPAEITKTIPSKSEISVTRTENYKQVEGLIMESVAFDGVTVENLSIPDWLLQSYGGNRVALDRDLEAGVLQNRGRCF